MLRYFLMREVVYGLDGDFSEERLIERYNADLANDLGNFTSRVLSMAARYFKGEITAPPGADGEAKDATLCEAFGAAARAGRRAGEDVWRSIARLEAIWQALDVANKYIVATAPFTLAKDPAKMPRVAQILANLVEGLRVIAVDAGAVHAASGGESFSTCWRRRDGGVCAVRRGAQVGRSGQAAGRALSAYRQER